MPAAKAAAYKVKFTHEIDGARCVAGWMKDGRVMPQRCYASRFATQAEAERAIQEFKDAHPRSHLSAHVCPVKI